MALSLHIVTPQGEAYGGDVERVVLPGSEGDFGVLAGHERFLAPLRVGEVEIATGGERLYAAVAGGFAEVSGDAVTVLVDSCELAADIDAARARDALVRAEQELARVVGDETAEHIREYEAALERAKTRIAVSERAQG